jgi:hypothetical protein
MAKLVAEFAPSTGGKGPQRPARGRLGAAARCHQRPPDPRGATSPKAAPTRPAGRPAGAFAGAGVAQGTPASKARPLVA